MHVLFKIGLAMCFIGYAHGVSFSIPLPKFKHLETCYDNFAGDVAQYFSVRSADNCAHYCANNPACMSFMYRYNTSFCQLKNETLTNITDVMCQEYEYSVYGEPTTEFLPRDRQRLKCTGGPCTNGYKNFRLCEGGGSGMCDPMQGRLEFFYNGQWGSVCDDSWTSTSWRTWNALTICGMFGYTGGGTTHCCGYYGYAAGSMPIYLDEIQCTREENTLLDCYHQAIGSHDCSHSEDAAVTCYL